MASVPLKTISIREFRAKLAEHMSADTPLAITRHGLTIGYYIPVHRPISELDRQALEETSRHLQTLLAVDGIDPEELIQDYQTLRKARKHQRG